MYFWLPRLGPLETHPFTIATPYKKTGECQCNEVQFAVRVQTGFSKRIHRYAMKMHGAGGNSLTGFITGPYGTLPVWGAYESLVLISASTGASFTMPILESILTSKTTVCTQRISFLLLVKKRSQIDFYLKPLKAAISQAEYRGIELRVEIAITSDADSFQESGISGKVPRPDSEKSSLAEDHKGESKSDPIVTIASTPSSALSQTDPPESKLESDSVEGSSVTESSRQIVYSHQRPNISEFIRSPVIATGGETAVAVCGGKSLVANVRNSVASLSNERAVHKGTGAQGIHLHVEEYCF
jgi:hypothetical protein